MSNTLNTEKFECPGCGLPVRLPENPAWPYCEEEYTCNTCYELSELSENKEPVIGSVSSSQFMRYWNDNDIYDNLTQEECIQIFLTCLKSANNVTIELLQSLFDEYHISNLKIKEIND